MALQTFAPKMLTPVNKGMSDLICMREDTWREEPHWHEQIFMWMILHYGTGDISNGDDGGNLGYCPCPPYLGIYSNFKLKLR